MNKKPSNRFEVATESGPNPQCGLCAWKQRDLIVPEELPSGTAMLASDLAKAVCMIETPRKDALRILETEGPIKYVPTGRPQVANQSLE